MGLGDLAGNCIGILSKLDLTNQFTKNSSKAP